MTSFKKNPNYQLIQAAVSALHKLGPLTRTELISMTGITSITLGQLARAGVIKYTSEYGDVICTITNAGRQTYGHKVEKVGMTPGRDKTLGGLPYDGADLRPFQGRAGSNDASQLKSAGFGC